MSDLSGAYAFLPWLRRGLGAAIDREDFGGPPAPRAAARITVALNEGSLTATAPLMLAGPGDVAQLGPQSVSRVWPRPTVNDATPNYFPLIEFHDADLPWRYTPAKATGRDRLRPWLCLIVLRDAEISSSSPATTTRVLPSVTVTSAAVLPRLDQSWAWAHTQVSGPQTIAAADVNALLATTPQRVVSRMLAPRRLDPQTPYTALLVPAFERARLAGIGQAVPDTVDGLAPAWSDGASNIELPIYYQWRFQTGTSGDFEYLVRQLQARVLPPTVGTRDMDVSHPGAGLSTASPQPLALEGALKALTTVSSAWPEPAHGQFVQALGTLLNTPAALLDQPNAVRVVAPPLYGRWHAARATLEPGQLPPWFQELNADPRTRVAAGLGTQVVQSRQQALMAAAWQQLDRIRAINERLRFAQFAREAAARIHVRHVATAGDEGVVQLTAPVHARVRTGAALADRNNDIVEAPVHARVRTGAAATSTIAAAVAASAIGAGVLRGQFRRIARPLGPIARRSREAAGGTRSSPPASPALLARMNAGTLRAAPPAPTPKSMATPARLGGGVPDWRSPEWVSRLQAAPAPTPAAQDFRAAATAVFRDLSAAPARATPIVALDIAATRETLVTRLDPHATITASIRSRLRLAPGVVWEPKDPLEPVMAAPEFPQPMSEALIALSQDWLLPGLELVLPNTVALLATNRPFVEAFMVGLNHEFARELLWNEYPTDQRGSYFRQFWNAAGRVPPPGGTIDPETTKDIRPIHAWAKTASLGDNGTQPDAPEPLVLLVRGDLLRRYPNALVYAVNAVQQPNQPRELGDEERHPLFRGRLDPDVSFFGFELTADEVRGGPGNAGWFFILQEQPSEPRFGLDVGDAPATASTKWLDLAWGHLAASPAALRAITYIDLNAPLPDTTHVVPEPGEPVVAWHADSGLGAAGSTASHLAYITLQRPARVAIHGSQLLP